jgi:hypothetical protein
MPNVPIARRPSPCRWQSGMSSSITMAIGAAEVLSVTLTPVGSPLRSQSLTACPVESHTFPDHTFPGPLGSNAATGPQKPPFWK